MGSKRLLGVPAQDDPKLDAKRRHFIVSSTMVAVGAGWVASASAQQTQGSAAAKKYKAVVHVTDGEPEKWTRVLGFVRGLQSTGAKDGVAIALVAQGLATDMLKADSPVAKGVSDLAAGGVEVIACEYSMNARKVSREQMNSSISSYVPFGGLEIIKRQGEGWAYLRP
jgi:intracellular sulfur oxidation DsrE/DsrF family protein